MSGGMVDPSDHPPGLSPRCTPGRSGRKPTGFASTFGHHRHPDAAGILLPASAPAAIASLVMALAGSVNIRPAKPGIELSNLYTLSMKMIGIEIPCRIADSVVAILRD
ncbi:hypothetical protein GCM10009827_051840 [Dactylosporangium maewongense]|uniref:Uncharacterized protein n=1 Tax=Dactylosporangium maewongense TaxID=634393 RepID=A0ABN2AV93_9ACTN